MRFAYKDIKFQKHAQENWLVVAGEITNSTGRSYHAVVFRGIVFIKTVPVANVAICINGFLAGQTRTFEVRVAELEYKILPEITRYEIYAESAY
jgi:hypothetical protein